MTVLNKVNDFIESGLRIQKVEPCEKIIDMTLELFGREQSSPNVTYENIDSATDHYRIVVEGTRRTPDNMLFEGTCDQAIDYLKQNFDICFDEAVAEQKLEWYEREASGWYVNNGLKNLRNSAAAVWHVAFKQLEPDGKVMAVVTVCDGESITTAPTHSALLFFKHLLSVGTEHWFTPDGEGEFVELVPYISGDPKLHGKRLMLEILGEVIDD